jgi:hypothetical protein
MATTDEADSTRPSAPPVVAKKKKRTTKAKVAVPRPVPARLADTDVAQARATGRKWDRHVRYTQGDYFVHNTFGVGLVTEARPELIVCLFEGGETRRLIHAR